MGKLLYIYSFFGSKKHGHGPTRHGYMDMENSLKVGHKNTSS